MFSHTFKYDSLCSFFYSFTDKRPWALRSLSFVSDVIWNVTVMGTVYYRALNRAVSHYQRRLHEGDKILVYLPCQLTQLLMSLSNMAQFYQIGNLVPKLVNKLLSRFPVYVDEGVH